VGLWRRLAPSLACVTVARPRAVCLAARVLGACAERTARMASKTPSISQIITKRDLERLERLEAKYEELVRLTGAVTRPVPTPPRLKVVDDDA
jgi:hypothetical protein